MADRARFDPWAGFFGATTTTTGGEEPAGAHDSVLSHNPNDPVLKLITEKNLKIEDFYGVQDPKGQIGYLPWARQMKNFIKT